MFNLCSSLFHVFTSIVQGLISAHSNWKKLSSDLQHAGVPISVPVAAGGLSAPVASSLAPVMLLPPQPLAAHVIPPVQPLPAARRKAAAMERRLRFAEHQDRALQEPPRLGGTSALENVVVGEATCPRLAVPGRGAAIVTVWRTGLADATCGGRLFGVCGRN